MKRLKDYLSKQFNNKIYMFRMITKLFIKEKIKSRIEENKDNLQLKVVNI
jgi:hypothetical protein